MQVLEEQRELASQAERALRQNDMGSWTRAALASPYQRNRTSRTVAKNGSGAAYGWRLRRVLRAVHGGPIGSLAQSWTAAVALDWMAGGLQGEREIVQNLTANKSNI